MAKVRFNIFNAEEFDDSLDVGGDAEVAVSEAIESEEQAIETEEEVNEVVNDIATTEEAEEVAEELIEKVEEQEEVLENTPEEVTKDTVAVAQEAFYIAISKINCLKEYAEMKSSISFESATTPAEKLKLSVEGVKDFVMALIERIKLAFMKIGELIKKLFVKFIVLMTNVEKKAKALSKELDKADSGKTVNLSDEQAEKITNIFKCFVAAGVVKSTKDLGKVLDTVSKVKGDLNTFANGVAKEGLSISARGDVMTKLAITKDASARFAPYYVKGTLRAIVITDNDGIKEPKYQDIAIENNGKVKKTTCKVGELKGFLGRVAKANSTLKEVVKAGQSAQDILYKELDSQAKFANENMKFGAARMEINNGLKLVRRTGTNVILDIILNYVYNVKNVLAVSALLAKELIKK